MTQFAYRPFSPERLPSRCIQGTLATLRRRPVGGSGLVTVKSVVRVAGVAALLLVLLAPATAWAQADYTGTPPPDAGSTLTDGDSPGAQVQGRQFSRDSAFDGSSAFDFSDLLLALPFLLVVLLLILFF